MYVKCLNLSTGVFMYARARVRVCSEAHMRVKAGTSVCENRFVSYIRIVVCQVSIMFFQDVLRFVKVIGAYLF